MLLPHPWPVKNLVDLMALDVDSPGVRPSAATNHLLVRRRHLVRGSLGQYYWKELKTAFLLFPVRSIVLYPTRYYGLLEGRALKFSRITAVLTDVHLWLPVIVLILGISLLIVLSR